jgi:hypothetical protein
VRSEVLSITVTSASGPLRVRNCAAMKTMRNGNVVDSQSGQTAQRFVRWREPPLSKVISSPSWSDVEVVNVVRKR